MRYQPEGNLDETNAEYHANPATSSTQAKKFDESPQLYRDYMDGLAPFKESDAMRLGTALHTKCLEPQHWDRDIAVCPYDSMRTKDSKAWKAEQTGTVITKDQSESVRYMHERCPVEIIDRIARSAVEVTYRTELDYGGTVQCRFDLLIGEDSAGDLKSTAYFDSFEKSIGGLKYWLSAGWYAMVYRAVTGCPILRWQWIVAESVPPYRWRVVHMPHYLLDAAEEYAYALAKRLHHANTVKNYQDREIPDADWEPKPWDLDAMGLRASEPSINEQGGINL